MSRGREYRSSLREEQARQTRLRIRSAARELFAQEGFAETTVNAIAERANVSPATVYSTYESKAGIVSAMLEELEESVEIGEFRDQVAREADPRKQLALWVNAHRRLFEAGSDVLRAALAAAQTPEVASLVERGDSNRRAVINILVREWNRKGALRAGLSISDAGDRMWLLTTTEAYFTAVNRLKWSPQRYESWLLELLETEILGIESSS